MADETGTTAESGASTIVDSGSTQSTETTTTQTPSTGSWLDSMPENLKTAQSLQKFKTVETLAQSYLNAEQLIGRDKIPMPKTEDEWKSTWQRLGCPDSPEKYGLKAADDLPESLKGPLGKDIEWFQKTAHSLGLSTKQASGLFDSYMANVKESLSQQQNTAIFETNQAKVALQQRHGANTAATINLAQQAMSSLMSDTLRNAVVSSGLGRNVEFIEFLSNLGDKMSEELGIDKSGLSMTKVSDLEDQLSKVTSDPAYLDATAPTHDRLVKAALAIQEQMVALHRGS
jgi:hypothetical protein